MNTSNSADRLIAAQDKLILAQTDMIVIYRTSALYRGATVADRLGRAHERVAKAKAAYLKLRADIDTTPTDDATETGS